MMATWGLWVVSIEFFLDCRADERGDLAPFVIAGGENALPQREGEREEVFLFWCAGEGGGVHGVLSCFCGSYTHTPDLVFFEHITVFTNIILATILRGVPSVGNCEGFPVPRFTIVIFNPHNVSDFEFCCHRFILSVISEPGLEPACTLQPCPRLSSVALFEIDTDDRDREGDYHDCAHDLGEGGEHGGS